MSSQSLRFLLYKEAGVEITGISANHYCILEKSVNSVISCNPCNNPVMLILLVVSPFDR